MISCGARLAPFDIKELRDLTEYDEMELDQIGERKTALFMIMSTDQRSGHHGQRIHLQSAADPAAGDIQPKESTALPTEIDPYQ